MSDPTLLTDQRDGVLTLTLNRPDVLNSFTRVMAHAMQAALAHAASDPTVRAVLITGALDFVVEPLRPLFDDIVSASLAVGDDGRYLGQMVDVPPTGESRASALFDYARLHDLDLAEAVAYADSSNDLPMLEVVGFPVAVNPEPRLASIARKRGWLVEDFRTAPGFAHKVLPIGPRWVGAPLDRSAR